MFVALAILVFASIATAYAEGPRPGEPEPVVYKTDQPDILNGAGVELSNFTAQTDEKGIVTQ